MVHCCALCQRQSEVADEGSESRRLAAFRRLYLETRSVFETAKASHSHLRLTLAFEVIFSFFINYKS